VPNKTITDLRNALFETLDALRDREHPMELDRAAAIANVAGKIIDTARVEVLHAKVTDQLTDGKFFERVAPDTARKLEGPKVHQ
jgi:hypothetical protein